MAAGNPFSESPVGYAQQLYDWGFNVLPAPVKAKSPNVPWKQWIRDRIPAEQIAEWFPDSGESNYWVAAGAVSGLMLLDTDSEATDRWWRARLGAVLDLTVCARSSKGYHYLFRPPEGEDLRGWSYHGDHDGERLDFDVRGTGGGVIVPPSIHESGAIYEWVRSPADHEMLPLPDALRSRAAAGLEATHRKAPTSAKAAGGLAELLSRPPVGEGSGRNDWLTRVAGHHAKTYRSDRGTYNALVRDANQRCRPPLPDQEAEKVADSIWSRERAKPEPVPLADSPLTEWAGARLRDTHRWVSGLGWLAFDGRVWRETPRQAITETVRLLFVEQYQAEIAGDADSDRRKALSQLLNRAKIGAVVGLLEGHLESDPKVFDAHPDLLNVGNGVVDLRSGELLPHDPNLFLTKITEVPYLPGATHPDWDQTLTALPPDVLPWMQIKVGQAATGYVPEDDKLPVCYGGGENAKTTFVTAIKKTLGGHAAVVPDKLLLANPNDHSTELTELMGVRFALLEELPDKAMSVKRLKDTVGKPVLTARRIRENNISWDATHTMFVTTNHLFRIPETDRGTWRRLALVRFPYTYRDPADVRADTDRPKDPGLAQRMRLGAQGQHEAVLAWVVAGARRWYDGNRVTPPPPAQVVADTEEWRAQTDLVLGFAREALVFAPGLTARTSEVYDRFAAWAETTGHERWAEQTFSGRFAEHELAKRNGVAKRRARRNSQVSSWGGKESVVPGQPWVWQGVGFRSHDHHPEEAPEDARELF